MTTTPDRTAAETETLVHLRAAGVSLLLDVQGPGVPRVLHWGADLGVLDATQLAALGTASRASGTDAMDQSVPVTLLPEGATGWMGRPGLSGHRDGAHWSSLLRRTSVQVVGPDGDLGGGQVVVEAADDVALLAVHLQVQLTPQGLVRTRVQVTSTASDSSDAAPFTVDDLVVALPVPAEATELHDLAGRWSRERTTHLLDNRQLKRTAPARSCA